MALILIFVAILAAVIPLSAFNHSAAKKGSDFEKIWETSMKQGIKIKNVIPNYCYCML